MRVGLRVRCLTRRASPWVIGAVCVAAVAGAPAALAAPRVLRVGTYHRLPGQFRTIQAAVDHARRGDGVLVAAGDYHERADHRHPPGMHSAVPPSGVLIRTPGLHVRGMSRRRVIGGRPLPGRPAASPPPSPRAPLGWSAYLNSPAPGVNN